MEWGTIHENSAVTLASQTYVFGILLPTVRLWKVRGWGGNQLHKVLKICQLSQKLKWRTQTQTRRDNLVISYARFLFSLAEENKLKYCSLNALSASYWRAALNNLLTTSSFLFEIVLTRTQNVFYISSRYNYLPTEQQVTKRTYTTLQIFSRLVQWKLNVPNISGERVKNHKKIKYTWIESVPFYWSTDSSEEINEKLFSILK